MIKCILRLSVITMVSLVALAPSLNARAGHYPHKAKLHHTIEKVEHAHRWCDNHPSLCAKHPAECADKRASDGSWDLDLEDAGE